MTATARFHPCRNLPDREVELTPSRGEKGMLFWELADGSEITLFRDDSGIFREPEFPKYTSLLCALLHSGDLKDGSIPIADFLNLNEDSVMTKGHLDLEVKEGRLHWSLGHHPPA